MWIEWQERYMARRGKKFSPGAVAIFDKAGRLAMEDSIFIKIKLPGKFKKVKLKAQQPLIEPPVFTVYDVGQTGDTLLYMDRRIRELYSSGK